MRTRTVYSYMPGIGRVQSRTESKTCSHDSLDARNASDTLAYYEKNGFVYLFPSEEIESMSTRKDKAVVPQNTRLMYFDLKDSTE